MPATDRSDLPLQLALAANTAGFVMLEVGLLRVLAVTSWYHFAFMVISVALLGGGVGPLLLTRRERTPDQSRALLVRLATWLPLVALAGFGVLQLVPFEPFSLLTDPAQWLWVPVGMIALAAPFVVAGAATALFFSAVPSDTRRLYFVDLAGAATGAALFGPLVAPTGAWGLPLVTAACWAVSAALLQTRPGLSRAAWAGALAAVVLAPLVGPDLPVRITDSKRFGPWPVSKVLADPAHTVSTHYHALGRVDVVRTVDGYRLLMDGGTAVTRLLDPGHVRRVRNNVGAVLHTLRPGSAFVLGSGGGVEVQQALDAGATDVVAVELHPVIADLVAGPYDAFLGGLFHRPEVRLVTAEARFYAMAGHERRKQAVLMAHTISNAALQSGGLALAESYALTVEAFLAYRDLLTDDGFVLVTRPAYQLERLAATAREAWRRAGIDDFEAHSLVVAGASRFDGLLLVSVSPLGDRREPLLRALRSVGMTPEGARRHRSARALTDPATDDRPFFNQRVALTDLEWADLEAAFEGDARLALEDRPIAEVTLVLLLVQLLVLGLLVFGLPLAFRRDRPRLPLRAGVTFLLLGLAFLFVEMSLVQQLTLYFADPGQAFAVVLVGMLGFAGLGSLADHRWSPDDRALPSIVYTLPLVLVATVFALPGVMGLGLTLPTLPRALLAIALIAPASFLMGRPFSRALRWAAGHGPSTAWAFALNGLASVMASLLAVMLAMTLGLRAVVFIAAGLYVVANLTFWRLPPPGGSA